MSDLADDIARIAALRGHDPGAVARKAAEIEQDNRRISLPQLEAIFIPVQGASADLAAMERLPAASRKLLREAPMMTSAAHYALCLEICGNEVHLIAMVRPLIAEHVADEARRRYSPDHPQARKLP